ncbi:MAG: ribonuclease HI family protein [Armatimonadota bacterium]
MTSVRLAIDGASKGNPGAAGIGVVIYNEAGEVIKEIGEYIGETTNNVAEYSALIRGLKEALKLGVKQIRVTTDSELLAKQVGGVYKVRAEHLAVMYYEVKELFSHFPDARIAHVPRRENAHADRLASDAARRRADYHPEGPARAAKKEKAKPAKPSSRGSSAAKKSTPSKSPRQFGKDKPSRPAKPSDQQTKSVEKEQLNLWE